METYWVPGVNRSGAYGRWAFAEFTDVYTIQEDFATAVAARAQEQFDGLSGLIPAGHIIDDNDPVSMVASCTTQCGSDEEADGGNPSVSVRYVAEHRSRRKSKCCCVDGVILRLGERFVQTVCLHCGGRLYSNDTEKHFADRIRAKLSSQAVSEVQSRPGQSLQVKDDFEFVLTDDPDRKLLCGMTLTRKHRLRGS